MTIDHFIETEKGLSQKVWEGSKKLAKTLYAFPSAVMDGDFRAGAQEDATTYEKALHNIGPLHYVASILIAGFGFVAKKVDPSIVIEPVWYYSIASSATNIISCGYELCKMGKEKVQKIRVK
jgi:hypothetical protein